MCAALPQSSPPAVLVVTGRPVWCGVPSPGGVDERQVSGGVGGAGVGAGGGEGVLVPAVQPEDTTLRTVTTQLEDAPGLGELADGLAPVAADVLRGWQSPDRGPAEHTQDEPLRGLTGNALVGRPVLDHPAPEPVSGVAEPDEMRAGELIATLGEVGGEPAPVGAQRVVVVGCDGEFSVRAARPDDHVIHGASLSKQKKTCTGGCDCARRIE